MSGLKKGHFDAAVERLLENAARFRELARSNAGRFSRSSGGASAISDLQERLDDLPSLSSTARRFASDECSQLEEDIESVRSQLKECSDQKSRAGELRLQASQSQGSSDHLLEWVQERLDKISHRAQRKIKTTDWASLALDKEVQDIEELRDVLEYRTAELERRAARMLSQGHDLEVAAQGGISALESAIDRLESDRSRIEELARQRYEAFKIREAQKKASVQSSEEIKVFVDEILKTEYERFLPGVFGGLNERVTHFKELFSCNDYKECSTLGPALVEDLKKFHEELNNVIQAFREAEKRTQEALKAAQEEVAAIDLKELSHWSQKGDEVQAAVAALEESAAEIERISAEGNRAAEFDAPAQKIVGAITSLRELGDLATDNHARWDARFNIARAVQNALVDLKYDPPEGAYHQETLPDGSADILSALTIYAHNPSGSCNIRLNIELDGDVAFEVFREDGAGNEIEEVTQKDAVACHQALMDFGSRLESVGITLRVTDWGKAKDLPEAQEQGRIIWDDADPDKKEQTGQRVQIGQQTTERKKEQEKKTL